MNQNRAVTFIFAFLCLILCTAINLADATDAGVESGECPGDDAAFVTTCSGSESLDSESDAHEDYDDNEVFDDETHASGDDESVFEEDTFDETLLVNEILEDYGANNEPQRCGTVPKAEQQTFQKGGGGNQHQHHGLGDMDEGGTAITAIQQLKDTIDRLSKQYYGLPGKAKCAVGAVCGFTSSRFALGIANRSFRVAGATWVLAETLHTSGFCDEAQCVPDEVRPWIGIARRAVVKQCVKVRTFARRVWDQDRIREFAQKDEMAAGGFAAGAFFGFIV